MDARMLSWIARCTRGAVAALAVVAACAAFAAASRESWELWEVEFDDAKKPWKEVESRLPPYPRTEDLVLFEGGGASQHRFYIDAKSLSKGEDGVVRYTLLVRTAGGATNVTFEGMRCETREQKYYALGRANGNWVRARISQWRRLEPQSINRHHDVLYADVFCIGKMPVATTREVLQRLKFGTRTAD